MTLRATPLDQTSIQTGGRRRELAKSRLARRGFHTHRTTHGSGHSRRLPAGAKSKTPGTSADQAERRRKSSLFRRLSNKRASAEIQQVTSSSLTEAKSEDKSMLSRGNTISRGFRSAGEHWVSLLLQSFRLQCPFSASELPRVHSSPLLVISSDCTVLPVFKSNPALLLCLLVNMT